MNSQSFFTFKKISGSAALLLLTLFCTTPVFSQQLRNSDYRYFGLEAAFGSKFTRLSSDLPAIDKMGVVEEGGSLGFVIGNQIVKTRLQAAGFYYSNSSVKQTVNMVESALLINVYPLKFINRSRQALNPYISTGVDYSTLKFFGYYGLADNAKINYSSSSSPYLGKVAATRGKVAAGLEWRLPQMRDFVHIFAEVRYSWNLKSEGDKLFANTTAANATAVNVGVSFGFLR